MESHLCVNLPCCPTMYTSSHFPFYILGKMVVNNDFNYSAWVKKESENKETALLTDRDHRFMDRDPRFFLV